MLYYLKIILEYNIALDSGYRIADIQYRSDTSTLLLQKLVGTHAVASPDPMPPSQFRGGENFSRKAQSQFLALQREWSQASEFR